MQINCKNCDYHELIELPILLVLDDEKKIKSGQLPRFIDLDGLKELNLLSKECLLQSLLKMNVKGKRALQDVCFFIVYSICKVLAWKRF